MERRGLRQKEREVLCQKRRRVSPLIAMRRSRRLIGIPSFILSRVSLSMAGNGLSPGRERSLLELSLRGITTIAFYLLLSCD